MPPRNPAKTPLPDTITVQKGIALPPRQLNNLALRDLQYPWPTMDAGDSFEIPEADPKRRSKNTGMLSSLGNAYAKRHALPWKFVARTTPTGSRVWRIA